jgi:hypothetical protein
MIKDIDFPEVKGVTVAVTRRKNKLNNFEWGAYIINMNDHPLENVLISSKGYGEKEGEKQATSILRHMFEQIDDNGARLIEPMDPDIFHLYNEYFVSYYVGRKLYDKRFIFVPESIVENNIRMIEEISMEGVLHS